MGWWNNLTENQQGIALAVGVVVTMVGAVIYHKCCEKDD